MPLRHLVLLSLLLIPVFGCGGGGENTTISGSELDNYVQENAEAVALQEQMDADLEGMEEEEEDD